MCTKGIQEEGRKREQSIQHNILSGLSAYTGLVETVKKAKMQRREREKEKETKKTALEKKNEVNHFNCGVFRVLELEL